MAPKGPRPRRLSLPFDRHRLREIRERKGFSQVELAQRLCDAGHQIDRSTIGRIEAGVFGPTPARLHALAKALDIEVDELLAEPQESAAERRTA